MASKLVLIVDDESLFRESLADSLAGRFPTARVETFVGGLSARARIAEEHVDLVVTDVRMADGDGVELLTWLADCEGPPRVIVATGDFDRSLHARLRALGALALLTKPIDLAFFHRTVAHLLDAPLVRIDGVTVAALMELLALQQASCVLRIQSGSAVGTVGLESGVIVSARFGDKRDAEALLAVHALRHAVVDLAGVRRDRLPISFALASAEQVPTSKESA